MEHGRYSQPNRRHNDGGTEWRMRLSSVGSLRDPSPIRFIRTSRDFLVKSTRITLSYAGRPKLALACSNHKFTVYADIRPRYSARCSTQPSQCTLYDNPRSHVNKGLSTSVE